MIIKRLKKGLLVAMAMAVMSCGSMATMASGVVATEGDATEEQVIVDEGEIVDAEDISVGVHDGKVMLNEKNFPDAVFRSELEQYADDEGYITISEVTNIGSHKAIKSFEGIQYFTELKTFWSNYGWFEEINFSGLEKLESVSLTETSVDKVIFGNNSSLKRVTIDAAGVKTLDFSGVPELEYLDLSTSVNLAELDITNNTKIKTLLLWGDDLVEINLSNLKVLEELEITCGSVALDISSNVNLKSLRLNSTEISKLNLDNNKELLTLVLLDNDKLPNLDLGSNIKLKELRLQDNALLGSEFQFKNNINLEKIEIYNSSVTKLDLSKNTLLTYLDCSNNSIVDLDLSNNKQLTYLNCANNKIKKLDLASNTKLVSINCNNNLISSMDLKLLPDLFQLDCKNNDLVSLDLSNCKKLDSLSCSGNKLSSLDLSENTVLKNITCDNNNLNQLNFCDSVTYVNMAYNEFTAFDFTKYSNLYYVVCEGNNFELLNFSKLSPLYGMNPSFSCDYDVNKLILDKDKKYEQIVFYTRITNGEVDLSFVEGLNCDDSEKQHYNKNTGIFVFGEDKTFSNSYPDDGKKAVYLCRNPWIKFVFDKYIYDVTTTYHTHIQTYGDSQGTKKNGEMAGTSGEAKRLENIWVKVEGNDNLGVQYSTHCQTYGWLPWSSNGETNGTSGESKRLEAIKIQLTGEDKDAYDIYYRVHAQSYGWLGWAKNGEPSGTAGYGKRLEGIQIVVVRKGDAAPGLNYAGVDGSSSKYSNKPYIAKTNETITIPGDVNAPIVSYKTHVQTFGWQKWVTNGQMSGTSGKSKRLEGINIKVTNCPYDGDIVYTTHVQKYGWKDGKPEADKSTWKKNGEMSGTNGEAKRLEAICIALTGEMADHYDIYYRVHAQSFGWLGWAKNGEESGTAGYAKRLEGIQIVLVPKGGAAPAENYGGITSKDARAYISK